MSVFTDVWAWVIFFNLHAIKFTYKKEIYRFSSLPIVTQTDILHEIGKLLAILIRRRRRRGCVSCGKNLIEFACSLITDVRNNHEEVKILHEINFDMHCCSLNIGIEWLKRKVFSQFNGILIALSQTCKSLINFHCRWHIFIIKLL